MTESDDTIRDDQATHAGDVESSEGALEHRSVHYEERDVSFRGVFIGVIVGVCVGVLLIGLVYAFFRADTDRLATRRESEFPLAEHPSEIPPPEPRLEEIDRLAGVAREYVYLAEEAKEEQLDSYGETAEKGFVRIPIRIAMESLAGQLPVRKLSANTPSTGPSKDNGLVDSGASNSGRMLRKAPR